MELANNFEIFQKELNMIIKQNPRECELYSIIACIIRERESSTGISLRDVSVARGGGNVNADSFKGKGFPDFVVLDPNYNYHDANDDEIFGAIEAKYIDKPLKLTIQIKRHIKKFKNVIYTNGVEWRFYELDRFGEISERWKVVLGKYIVDSNKQFYKDKIEWDSNEKWHDLLSKLDTINWKTIKK